MIKEGDQSIRDELRRPWDSMDDVERSGCKGLAILAFIAYAIYKSLF